MGSGYFDPGAYDDHIRAKAAAGSSTFSYSDAQTAGTRVVHPDLDPRRLNSFGQLIRESLDSDEHPDSMPIVVVLDVTGTMSSVVYAIHASLKNLYNLLLTKGYVQHPQIMFMAVGDSSISGARICVSRSTRAWWRGGGSSRSCAGPPKSMMCRRISITAR